MIEWIMTVFNAIQSNTIVAGIFGTTVLSGLAIYLRNLPMQFFDFILNFFTITVVVDLQSQQYEGDRNPAFLPIYSKLSNLKKFTFQKQTELSVVDDYEQNYLQNGKPISSDRTMLFSPAQNIKYFAKWDNLYIVFTNSVDTSNKLRKNFIIHIRFFTRNQKKIDELLYSCVNDILKNDERNFNKLRYNKNSDWHKLLKEKIFSQPPFLLTSIQEEIYHKIAWFLNNKDKFNKIGKPYHTGFVFHGKPGCGKSHFVQKLSEEFELPIYILNLTEIFGDNTLVSLLKEIKKNAIVLIEDIDRFSISGKSGKKAANLDFRRPEIEEDNPLNSKDEVKESLTNFVSMSTILNVIDGIYGTNSGLIFIATTNHIEKLDKALIRQGRFDYIYEFDYLTRKDICNFIEYNYQIKPSVKLNEDIKLPISIVTNICFETGNIDECIIKLNSLEEGFRKK